jgi:formamidopyrimidine-DNA glycosylase
MPEGPEIKIVARQVSKNLVGWTLVKINTVSGPYRNHPGGKYVSFRSDLRKRFKKSVLSEVGTKGKLLYWELTPVSNDNVVVNDYLTFGFGLTGGFVFNSKGQNHVRFEFLFTKGNSKKTLYFVDQRNFGTVTFLHREGLNAKLNELGPDIFKVEQDKFVQQFKHDSIKNNEIAKAMLNQKIVSGIGNYLRAEILYRAKVAPLVRVKDLNEEQLIEIYRATQEVIKEVMENGGTANYKDTVGSDGKYKFRVYMQTTDPNGKFVRKTKLSGRTIYHIEN